MDVCYDWETWSLPCFFIKQTRIGPLKRAGNQGNHLFEHLDGIGRPNWLWGFVSSSIYLIGILHQHWMLRCYGNHHTISTDWSSGERNEMEGNGWKSSWCELCVYLPYLQFPHHFFNNLWIGLYAWIYKLFVVKKTNKIIISVRWRTKA